MLRDGEYAPYFTRDGNPVKLLSDLQSQKAIGNTNKNILTLLF